MDPSIKEMMENDVAGLEAQGYQCTFQCDLKKRCSYHCTKRVEEEGITFNKSKSYASRGLARAFKND